MPRNSSAVLVLVVCLLTSIAGFAQAPPSADTYVTSTMPAANFGASPILPVQAGTTSYIRLNLAALPANAGVAKATLRLYVNAIAAPGSFDVYQIDSAWSELSLTFNGAPPLGASATAGQPVSVTALSLNQFVLIDITGLVQGWLDGSIPNQGVALTLTSSGGSFSFDSKESTGTGHQPELEVIFDRTAGPSITAGTASAPNALGTGGVTPGAPTDPYVINGTVLQTGTNFNIDGRGSAATFNAISQYLLNGVPVLGSTGTSSLFVGAGAGQNNTGSLNTFLGVSAGQSNTSGYQLTFVGTQAGFNNTTGLFNTFLGATSGFNNTTGYDNTFLGQSAGFQNKTGAFNTFAGTLAGQSNTSGSQLTFVGMQAGYNNTTGMYNSFVGTNAGYNNTTGYDNTFFGQSAGFQNKTGAFNTFTGTLAGQSNTSGSQLTFLGMQAGYNNTTGQLNSFVGTNAGYGNSTGSSNAFVGVSSGFQNTTGAFNTFVGTQAGQFNVGGQSNTYLGYNAGFNGNPAGSNNIYLSSLGASADNGTIRIGDPPSQTSAYIAGIYGNSPAGALPVVINANGQLGTTTAGIGVTSFNGRTGAVVSAANDYNFAQIAGTLPFSQLSGTLSSAQLGGTYTNALTLNNGSNAFSGSFTGNGAGLAGVQPAPGSPSYIQIGGTPQAGSFNITGNGIAGGIFSANAVNSATNYEIGGSSVLSTGAPALLSIFVGQGAGSPGITGNQNSFVGNLAGQSNTTGGGNSFFGYSAGVANTTAGNNSFFGTQAGSSTTTGNLNAFFGSLAGNTNTIGQNNSFFGSGAGSSNTTGSSNVSVGANTGGSDNTNVGANVFVGVKAGFNNTTGGGNTIMGFSAGVSNTSGSYNAFYGYGAGQSNTTGSSNVYIAAPGIGAENNTIRIGSQGTGQGQQNAVFIAGVSGAATSAGVPVFIDATGKLGTTGGGASGVTSFNGRTGAVVPAANDYSFSQLSGSVGTTQLTGTYANPLMLSNASNFITGTFTGTGAGITGLQFSQLGGNLASSQFSGTYANAVQLTNAGNTFAGSFNGAFSGNGSGLTGVKSGLNWPIVTKTANYTIQTSDFSTPASSGNFVILTGSISRTFTLPNPAPPNGSCVAIGDFAVSLPGSNTNVFLTMNASGLAVDGSTTVPATQIGWEAFLYCSDGTNYYRLGRAQVAPNKLGPWLETLDTGTTNVLKTTFVHGLDVGLATGSMFYIRPINTITGPATLNVNGLGARNIVKFGNQPLAPGDLTTAAYAHVFFDGTNWQLLNPQTAQGTITSVTATGPLQSTGGAAPTISCPTCVAALIGTTTSIGGSALSAGSCASGTAAVTGAQIGHPVAVSASDGSLPSGLIMLSAAVTSANTVTVQLCAVAAVTPPANTYNVATQ